MSRLLRIILFVILVLLLLLIGFRCSQQAPEGGQTGLLDSTKQTANSVADTAKAEADTVINSAGSAMDEIKTATDTVDDSADSTTDEAKTGADAVGDATESTMDAAKTDADAVGDATDSAMDAAKTGADVADDATDSAMDMTKTGADAVGDTTEDSLNTTAHSVIDDGIKTVVAWAKSTPISADAAESSATEASAASASTTTATTVAATATTAGAAAATKMTSADADSLNATAHSVIDDGINTVIAWAKSGGTTPETAATSEAAATSEKAEAPKASAPTKAATTEVSAKTMSAGSSIRLDGVNFATGSDRLIGNSKSLLDNVAKVLSEKEDVKVEVAGYTDSTGNAALNKSLSQKRAAKVKAYLASKGIPADRMTAVGHGQESPIADNTTSAGRKANRRVELHVK